ncbi:hypothetical protein [Actinomadura sp. 6K520]|jgi:hypothetical protein|uniref:hypothetical protein n=1 Tax=Actinomadura sp. 6K520 TaxID=2530364 RepID=UPI00104AAA7F|nr:hypothetical protein [Actinomadura sp. 6K520]TDE34730.1 hypothetical protein E1289_09380 [Actinomadura sp. 6K520]
MSQTVQRLGRKKILILGAAALLVLALAGGAIAYLAFRGEELTYQTQAAMRKALPATAAAELHERGVRLAGPLKCEDLAGRTKDKLRVSCTGATSDKKPVAVFGSAERETAESHYTILVAGEPVVENAPCLGADCHGEEG